MKLRLTLNPVLAREARVRMRGWRAPALISLYVGLLSLVVWLILWVSGMNQQGVFSPELGSITYSFLVFAQFALLYFATPGLTAGAIAGEREKQTLDLLLVTRMSPLQVVTGKLGAALAFTVLLMFASLPVYGVLFLFGGVSIYRLFLTVIVYVVTVIWLGAIGVYFSALFKRTQAAVVAAYGVSFGLTIATLVAGILATEVLFRPQNAIPDWTAIFAYTNPLMALAAAGGGPVAELTSLYRNVLTTPAAREAIWWKYCIFALGTAALLVWLTARRIGPERAQKRRRRAGGEAANDAT